MIFEGSSDEGIPALCWRLKEDMEVGFTLYDLADRLRSRGWQVPAYSLPADQQEVVIQRILVRHGVSRDLAGLLLEDIADALSYFKKHPLTNSMTAEEASGFSH